MAILPTHRYGIEYLEHCKVVAADERLSYIRSDSALEKHFSIPYANVAILLLGPGTSITQPAARLLSSQQVLLGFCGGGGVPVLLGALNEYRPTEYLQRWIPIWQDQQRRLAAAKRFQRIRTALVRQHWVAAGIKDDQLSTIIDEYNQEAECARNNSELLLAEAAFAKRLYGLLSKRAAISGFTRRPQSDELINQLLDQGNYLAYGLAAVCLWTLGIPHSLPLNHGQTRRGALVFDVADLVKDALIMPLAFELGARGVKPQQFRAQALEKLDDAKALKVMFESVIGLTHPSASSSQQDAE